MTAALLRLLTGATARWVGFDPDEAIYGARPCIFFANHTSNLDGPVIWASLPLALRTITRPVAAHDYWSAGPLRRYLAQRVFNCVLVERHHVTKTNNPLTAMEAALAAGQSLIIFPEGTRSMDGALGEFRPGLFHLARGNPAVRLVPVYLQNLNRILPKGEMLLIPLLASVRFGAPIELQPAEAKINFLARARAAIEALRGDEARAG